MISAGRRCARIARDIRERDQGRTRLVHVGRAGGEVADVYDAVVTPCWARLWPHPNRIETLASLVRTAGRRATFGRSTASVFRDRPKPHVLLLARERALARVGSHVAQRMERDVADYVAQAGGSLHVARAGGDEEIDDLIGRADAVVVAGNDEWLVSRAVASSTPVYVYPLAPARLRVGRRLQDWIERRAHTRPQNRRGTPRPQQGLEYLCARLIERGMVRPARDSNTMHQELYRRGLALPFGAPLSTAPRTPLREVDAVADRVRDRLGFTIPDATPATFSHASTPEYVGASSRRSEAEPRHSTI